MGKKYLRAEIWDRLQFYFTNFYDRTTHSVIYYENHIKTDILEDIYFNLTKMCPIFRSTYKHNIIIPYWKINEVKSSDYFKVIKVDESGLDNAINQFVYTSINHKDKVQFQIRVFRSEKRDTVVSLYNHMLFDGGEFKYINDKIIEAYNNLSQGKLYTYDFKTGTRSFDQVYQDMSKEDRKAAKALYHNPSRVKEKVYFPYTPKSALDTPRVIRTTMNSDTFIRLKAKSKATGFTINDVFMAAYARATYNICKLNEDNLITIPIMVDLRRYIKGGQTKGITNMTSFMDLKIKGVGNNIIETADKIKLGMNACKQDKFIGLHGLPLLKLGFSTLPQFICEMILKLAYSSPLLSVSNVGIINEMDLEGSKIDKLWFSGGINYKPYFRVAIGTIAGNVYFCCPFKGNDEDERIVNTFIDNMKNEILNFINS